MDRSFRAFTLGFLVFALMAFLAGTASAVTIAFSGTVTSDPDGLGYLGDTWTFTIDYDQNDPTPDIDPDPNRAAYYFAFTSFSITVGSGSFSHPTFAQHVDIFDTPGFDLVGFVHDSLDGIIGVHLMDSTGTAVTSQSLASTAGLELSDFDSATMQFDFANGVFGQITGSVDSMVVSNVPEPSTALMLVIGLAGLAGVGRPRYERG